MSQTKAKIKIKELILRVRGRESVKIGGQRTEIKQKVGEGQEYDPNIVLKI